jgi:uncharacterized membrane protein YiaA
MSKQGATAMFAIGLVVFLIGMFWGIAGFYAEQAPFVFGLMIVGGIPASIGLKIMNKHKATERGNREQ